MTNIELLQLAHKKNTIFDTYMFYLTTAPFWLKALYANNLTWNKPTKDKTVYLTFDDGPHEIATPFVLNELVKYNAKATFFCIGNNVKQHPNLYKEILHLGHTTGNHTMNHINGWKADDEAYIKDILEASHFIDSQLFRPPYGRINKFKVNLLKDPAFAIKNLEIIMWSVLSGDFDEQIDGEKCYKNVIKNIKPGSIIVFHDSAKALPRLQYALPKVLDWLNQKGFTCKSL